METSPALSKHIEVATDFVNFLIETNDPEKQAEALHHVELTLMTHLIKRETEAEQNYQSEVKRKEVYKCALSDLRERSKSEIRE